MIFLPKGPRSSSISQNRFLSKDLLLEILHVTTLVKNTSVTFMGQNFGYENICARWNGKCYMSAGEKLLKKIDEFFSRDDSRAPEDLRWPVSVWYAGDHFEDLALPQAIGSPALDAENFVMDAEAFRVSFFLRSDTELSTQA
jgi:hypothetical protein